MKFNSLVTKLFILLSAMVAFAFNGDDKPVEFYLSSNRIYSPGDQGIAVDFGGQISRRTALELRAYRILDPVRFFLAQKNPHSPGSSSEEGASPFNLRDAAQFKSVASWQHKVTSRDRYWQYESIPVPVSEKGVYLVQAGAGGKVAATVLIVTELGLIVKQTQTEALAFVVNRHTGERVSGMPITFTRGGTNSVGAVTGNDGVATTTITKLLEASRTEEIEGEPWGWGYGNQILVLGGRGEDFAISDSYYSGHYGVATESSLIYLHTDRPVYRPAQTVYYRGIVRTVAEDGTYGSATMDSAQIEVTDSRGGSIAKATLAISDFGTFNGEILLGDEPPLGNYYIKVTAGSTQQGFSFSVEEYKKPEYEVTVSLDKKQYTKGDLINATIKADYYFGSPVAEGDVEYFIYRSRYWRPWWWRSKWSYLFEDDNMSYARYGTEMIHSGRGKLAPDGTLSFAYTTPTDGDDDYIYRVQANVVDASRRSIAGSASVKVTRGEFYIMASTGKYVYKPGDDATVKVETIAFDGDRGISSPFNVRVERIWWDDRSRSQNRRREELVWRGSGSTNADGAGSVTFKTDKAGYYSVVVEAKDNRGNAISTSSSVYVTDGSYADWYTEENTVQVIPDRDLYKPGEMMSALVIMPTAGLDALISSEGATLYGYQVERLNSTSAIVRIRIEDRFAPMFYLTASAMGNGTFYTNSQRIAVEPVGKVIALQVSTDRPVYKPGDKGTVRIRAIGDDGEPVPNTDVAVAMVDEALYAIRPDATTDIQKAFYGTRYNQVSTNTSLNFSFYGHARIRASGVAAEMSDALGMAPPPPAPMMAKAARAADEAKDMVEPAVRVDFRDLMFWTPSVRTDASGYATVEVSFPDNLTTWRVTARGITAATAVGQTTAEVIARKDLLVRMETPRFLTQGDELLIATTIHNYLSTEKRTKVVFAADGVRQEEREREVRIAPNGETRIDWKIKAEKHGTARLTVKALTNEESDAMELSIPILPQGVQSGTGALADIDEASGTRTITLVMPENADARTAALSIALSPSVASSVLGALDELIGYPYGCVEQTMSRFLPTAVVAQALDKINIPFDQTKKAELPKMVAKGLSRLYNLQHDDGGWGWWEHDQTNPFMTAYVMYGMTVAKEAGYAVESGRYERGIATLRTLIETRKGGGGMGQNNEKLDPTTEAYMLYVAAFIRKGAAERLYIDHIRTLARRADINNYTRALLALAAHYQGEKSLATDLAGTLAANAQVSATAAQWSGKSWHYNWQDDQVETSAYAVKALLEIQGETDLVKKGIHFLLGQKRGDAWHNTRQTAMVIYALVDYLQSSRELEPDYTMTVRVNGAQVYAKRMTHADVFAPEQGVKIDHSKLRTGENTITVEKSGHGRLYATARLNYYAVGPAVKASDAGFKVQREYYTLRRTMQNGRYVYLKQPFKGTVRSGDELFVKVKILPGSRHEYFMLEDPLPAGCEVITNADGYIIPGEQGFDNTGERYGYGRMIWNWWYADRDVRDEKVAFFAREIQAQPYEFSYIMRAQIPGSYSVMPSVGMLMYYPEVRGNSDAIALRITE